MLRRFSGFSQGLKIIQSPVTVLMNEEGGLKSEGKEVILPTEKPNPTNSAPEATMGPWPSWQRARATAQGPPSSSSRGGQRCNGS